MQEKGRTIQLLTVKTVLVVQKLI